MDDSTTLPLNLSTDRKIKKKITSLEDCVNERWKAATLKAIAERFATNEEQSINENNAGKAENSENDKDSSTSSSKDENEKLNPVNGSILDHYHSFMQRRVVPDLANTDDLDIMERRSKRKRKNSSRRMNVDDDFGDFAPHVMKNEFSSVQSFVTNMTIPERTIRQNNWALKVWRDWAEKRNLYEPDPNGEVPLDIDGATVEQMGYWLPRFIKEVRRRDGYSYPAETLMQIASGLQRYLRHVAGRQDMTFFDKYSTEFAEFREALRNRSGEVKTNSGAFDRKLSRNEDVTYNTNGDNSNLFSTHDAKGIFRAVFYCNYVDFQISSMEEHHELQVEQYSISRDKILGEYVEFTSKDNATIRKYKSSLDAINLVDLFKSYFSNIPSSGPFYRRPLLSSDTETLRFSFNPVGINKLRETYKMLFTGGRNYADFKRQGRASTELVANEKANLAQNQPTAEGFPSMNGSRDNEMQTKPETSNRDSTLVINVPETISEVVIIKGKKTIKIDLS